MRVRAASGYDPNDVLGIVYFLKSKGGSVVVCTLNPHNIPFVSCNQASGVSNTKNTVACCQNVTNTHTMRNTPVKHNYAEHLLLAIYHMPSCVSASHALLEGISCNNHLHIL